ncbi:MAG: GH25 family lysozyme [Bacillota bacterium]|nr:GH25 family lysozyme [Bacillota bacterium]
MKGIDISPYQGNVDFQEVKNSGVEVVYIKATEGKTYVANTLKDYYNQAKSVGLKVGFYHFLRANAMQDEVNNLINATAGLPVDCKYAIDCEVDLGQSLQQITNNVRTFFDLMKAAGKECVLYTYSSFLTEYINLATITDIPIWIANYGSHQPSVPNFVGWQYSEHGSVPGITGDCDLDVFSEAIFTGNTSSNPVKAEAAAITQVNDTIKTIQQQLNTLLKKNLVVDGIEGPQTDSTIREFQKAMGLSVDGIWGPRTAGAADQILSRSVDGVPYPHYEYATRYIQYRCGGSIDGTFGNQTKINVQNWQASHRLVPDGVVGSQTWSKLLDENC